MSTAKKPMKAKTNMTLVKNDTIDVTKNVNIEGLTEPAMRARAVDAAALLFSKPQFSLQVNAENILGLADVFYKYMSGEITIKQPSAQLEGAGRAQAPTAPTFS